MAGISGSTSRRPSGSKRKRISSSPKRAISKIKRNNFKSNSRSMKKSLKSYIYDDEALKHRIRHLESQKETLDHKILYLDQKLDGHRKKDALLQEAMKQCMKDMKHAEKNKTKLEREVQHLNFKMGVLKKKLCKVEGEKSKLERQLNSSGLFTDMLNNFKELFETNLQCSICSEIFLFATVITCGHTFCEDCIEEWTSKKNNCPICRANIKGKASNVVLDEHIEKMVEQFFPETEKKSRKDLVLERKTKKMNRVSNINSSNKDSSSDISDSDDDDDDEEEDDGEEEEEDVMRRHLRGLTSDDSFEFTGHPIMTVSFNSSSDDDSYSPLSAIEEEDDHSVASNSSNSSTEGFTSYSDDSSDE
ncbi:E3 ubiquitin-protein ligase rnf8-B [Lepeophtheirus salmonis]|uniref:E3 ubiquitin-protein ligase rnf8-B n=1 Tax=Lepeophtheirus salmonis TaxID=72036 RepID=UPI001AE6B790|nr:E3 ubiquitin-protein ligase rnf8-B-like [Lepeophtheirus salmonis]